MHKIIKQDASLFHSRSRAILVIPAAAQLINKGTHIRISKELYLRCRGYPPAKVLHGPRVHVEVRKYDVAKLVDAVEEGDGCTWQLAIVHGYAENSCLVQKEDGNFLFWLVSMSIITWELVSTVFVFESCAGRQSSCSLSFYLISFLIAESSQLLSFAICYLNIVFLSRFYIL